MIWDPSGSSQAFPLAFPGHPETTPLRGHPKELRHLPQWEALAFGVFLGLFSAVLVAKIMGNHGKMMGNPWKIQGKLTEIMGKSWENEDKPQYKGWANHGKLWEV